MTERDGTHEEAVVDKVFYGKEDHGILTCCLYLRLGTGGSGQGFGNLVLDPETSGPDFKRSLSEFFGKPFDAIVGSKCFALRCWGHFQDHIVGLELPSGKRFTLYAWRKKHWPDTQTPLEERRKGSRNEIAWLERRLREERERLENIAEGYVDWERP